MEIKRWKLCERLYSCLRYSGGTYDGFKIFNQKILKAPNFDIINLGTGNGVSVLEAIAAFEEVSGKKLNYDLGLKKKGDVGLIYSNCRKTKETFDWEAQRDIKVMMKSAWDWQLNQNKI